MLKLVFLMFGILFSITGDNANISSCEIPEIMHPLAKSALVEWQANNLTTAEFVRYATLVNSDNFIWVECLIK